MKTQAELMSHVMHCGVWELGDFNLSSGAAANNFFDMPRALYDFNTKRFLLDSMKKLVMIAEPDAL